MVNGIRLQGVGVGPERRLSNPAIGIQAGHLHGSVRSHPALRSAGNRRKIACCQFGVIGSFPDRADPGCSLGGRLCVSLADISAEST